MSHHAAKPLGGRLFTPATVILLSLGALALGLMVYRFVYGVGSITAMSDAYPWGIWKPLNVVTFTGLAAGAYGVGLLTYVMNRGEFHPLVRPAVLVGALGYTLGGLSTIGDLGRWWNFWRLNWIPWFNTNSILLEVAVCVMLYTAVLWVEFTPAILERLQHDGRGMLRSLSAFALPKLKRVLPFVIALAIVLPTMHQSSLGSMFMLAGYKVHPLWQSPLLPLLFLMSCLTMGFGGVILFDTLAWLRYRHGRDARLLSSLGWLMVWLLGGYVAVRLADLTWRGQLSSLATLDRHTLLLFVELALFIAPAVLLVSDRRRRNPGVLFGAALLTLAGGALYRFDTWLIAFNPGEGWHYFPSVGEILVSLGFVAGGAGVFVLATKLFPVLSPAGATATAPVTEPAAAPELEPASNPQPAIR